MDDAKPTITGVAWDHRRCWGPLDASVADWAARGTSVTWDRRSLYSFGEGDLEEHSRRHDLVIFDHPFVGEASRDGYLLDLAPYLDEAARSAFAADSVGRSWDSYWVDGGLYALPIDAAAQTAAWRADLMEEADAEVPRRLDDVFALAERVRAGGRWIGFPAKPTDLLCTFISLAASLGETPAESADHFVGRETGRESLALLRRLTWHAHPESRGWNPIRCFDHMSSADDVVYCPYAFNYVNYASLSERALTFGSPPSVADGWPARSLLGGAGIGVSATSQSPDAAYQHAAYLCSPAFQATTYVREGGQPGSRAAWLDAECNRMTRNFLRDTLPALDAAYLRPTMPGFVPLFREGTHRITAVVFKGAAEDAFLDWFDSGYAALCTRRGQAQTTP